MELTLSNRHFVLNHGICVVSTSAILQILNERIDLCKLCAYSILFGKVVGMVSCDGLVVVLWEVTNSDSALWPAETDLYKRTFLILYFKC